MPNNYQEYMKMQNELYDFQKKMAKEAFKMFLLKCLILSSLAGLCTALVQNAGE